MSTSTNPPVRGRRWVPALPAALGLAIMVAAFTQTIDVSGGNELSPSADGGGVDADYVGKRA